MVASGGEHDPPPDEEGGHQRPEEHECQVSRGEEQQERYPDDGDREHHAEHYHRRHGGHPEEQGHRGRFLCLPRRRGEWPWGEDRHQHAAGREHRGGEQPTHDVQYPEPAPVVVHLGPHACDHLPLDHGFGVLADLAATTGNVAVQPGFRPQLQVSTAYVDVSAHGSVHVHIPEAGVDFPPHGGPHLDVPHPRVYVPADAFSVHLDVAEPRVDVSLDRALHRDVPGRGRDLGRALSLLHGYVAEGLVLESVCGERREGDEAEDQDGEGEQRPYEASGGERRSREAHASPARRLVIQKSAAARQRSRSAPTARAARRIGPAATSVVRATSVNFFSTDTETTGIYTAYPNGSLPSRARAAQSRRP